jgi:cyd operon protein YbgT
MWYFSWVLGLGLACAVAILNAMWFEVREDTASSDPPSATPRDADGTLRS